MSKFFILSVPKSVWLTTPQKELIISNLEKTGYKLEKDCTFGMYGTYTKQLEEVASHIQILFVKKEV